MVTLCQCSNPNLDFRHGKQIDPVFESVDELVAAIELFVLAHNEAQTIRLDQKSQIHLEKIMRAKAKLKTVQIE